MIIRVNKKDQPYVLVSKELINDKSLSLKAKGIMVYLLSKPDGWHVRIGDLINQNTDGEKAVRSGVKELKEAGYMVPVIERDPETQRVLKYDYEVREKPLAGNGKVDKPLAGKRKVGKRKVGNRQVNNKGLLLINESSKEKGEVNNNNKSIKETRQKDIIITVQIKHKRKFNKIQQEIINLGWAGSLDEIIEFHNTDPDFVRGWVERIAQIQKEKGGSWAGLLRKSLRSGNAVPTQEEIENQQRKGYLDDPYSEFIVVDTV